MTTVFITVVHKLGLCLFSKLSMKQFVACGQWPLSSTTDLTAFVTSTGNDIYLFLFIQFINQQCHRSTSNDIEIQTKNILAERPTQD